MANWESDHDRLDARSLAMHKFMAERLKSHPERLSDVQATLGRLLLKVDPRSRPYLERWKSAADEGVDAFVALMIDPSEEGKAMRQSSPCGDLISNKERWSFIEKYSVAKR